jgi:hypothetical protein
VIGTDQRGSPGIGERARRERGFYDPEGDVVSVKSNPTSSAG